MIWDGFQKGKKIGSVRFPGTNCDFDVQQMCESLSLLRKSLLPEEVLSKQI